MSARYSVEPHGINHLDCVGGKWEKKEQKKKDLRSDHLRGPRVQPWLIHSRHLEYEVGLCSSRFRALTGERERQKRSVVSK